MLKEGEGREGDPPAPPEEATLAGYFDLHSRPPAFAGPDGHPYTVSLEVEKTTNLAAPFCGYLVFPRWAETGVGIVGHLETFVLLEGRSREEVRAGLGRLTLTEVKSLLDEAVHRRQDESV